jgi:ferredoxin
MKARVDQELCAACSVCVDVCPEVFDLNDEGMAVVTVEIVAPDYEDACRDAAEQCPSEAIVIDEG